MNRGLLVVLFAMCAVVIGLSLAWGFVYAEGFQEHLAAAVFGVALEILLVALVVDRLLDAQREAERERKEAEREAEREKKWGNMRQLVLDRLVLDCAKLLDGLADVMSLGSSHDNWQKEVFDRVAARITDLNISDVLALCNGDVLGTELAPGVGGHLIARGKTVSEVSYMRLQVSHNGEPPSDFRERLGRLKVYIAELLEKFDDATMKYRESKGQLDKLSELLLDRIATDLRSRLRDVFDKLEIRMFHYDGKGNSLEIRF